MRRYWYATCVLVAVMVAGSCTSGAGPPRRQAAPPSPSGEAAGPQDSTRRLEGEPLAAKTGLTVLVAADPPVLIDIDRSRSRAVAGFPSGRDRTVNVFRVGRRVVVESYCDSCANGDLFLLDQDQTRLKQIGSGAGFVPSADGRGVWVLRMDDRDRCSLAQISLTGQERTPARKVGCDRALLQDTAVGLVWTSQEEEAEAVILPSVGGLEVFRAPRIIAVVGTQVLSDDPAADAFVLTDVETGQRVNIPKPTSIGEASEGLLSPNGRMLAISFDQPALPGPRQRMDTWVLDLPTRRWTRLPSMPVNAALKFTGMAWTKDGELLLLGLFDDLGEILALWRPGSDQLALREIDLPPGGANAFVAL